MKRNSRVVAVVVSGLLLIFAGSAHAQRYMEKLDRGLVAVKSGSGYFLSWRLFGTDPQDTTFGFNVYRGTTKLNSAVITNSTNYLDSAGGTGTYTVKAVTGSVEGETSEAALVIDSGYLNIPLTPPAAGSAHGSSYTETANDASIGDLDGDGQYEIVLKWDPSNSKDNASQGYTGPTYLDGYKLSGKQMWRISLGPNIRSGAHYTQFMVYDLDGDGSAEIACKTAPGTKDGTGNYLKTGPAATADHTIDYTSTDTATQGKVITGPEYYTIFSGKTGAELVTVDYKPGRGAEGVWGAIQGIASPAGDLGWGNDSNYNFVDRFLASVAYLDGERPSVIPCRGYYWRSSLWALDWRNGQLTERWLFDTAAVPGAKGKDGKPLQSSTGYESQGSHSLRQGDVDGDGFDEIVYGSATIDHDGQGLYSTGLRHGDALHMADMDPNRPGLEVYMVDEQTSENNGIASHFQDAKDGTIIWEDKASGDNGRGCAGPIMAGVTGWQMWSNSGGLFNSSHAVVGSNPSSKNFTIWWGAELERFFEDGTSITPLSGSGGMSASGCASNNGSKSTPALTADIFGDWREEVMYRTSGNDALRIYTTTTPTTHRLYTLMHDPIYRMSVATENVAYNQPPEPGIYIGPGMTLPETPPKIKYYGTGGSTGTTGTGGSTGTTGTGGSTGTTSTGGSTGTTSTGGSTGTTSTGGSTGTSSTGGKGGTTPGTGGTAGSVTTSGTGGASSGGVVGSGGVAKGGAMVSGGATSSGGIVVSSGGIVVGNGGIVVGNGGAPATGGSTTTALSASGGSTATSTAGGAASSGCGCRLGGPDHVATLWGAMLAFGALVAAKLRRRGKSPSRRS